MTLHVARCLLADDHPALLAAVGDFLSGQGFEVVGPASDGWQSLALAESEQPELAVVDYRMPRLAGGDLVARIKQISPDTRVAVYTADADDRVVADALAAGADAVVLKEAPLADLARALTSILGGRPYLDPALAGATFGGREASVQLTTRELEVLELLAEGLSHEEIGRRLEIAGETVRTHSRKAADRLGARTRTQAVATAIRLGFLS